MELIIFDLVADKVPFTPVVRGAQAIAIDHVHWEIRGDCIVRHTVQESVVIRIAAIDSLYY